MMKPALRSSEPSCGPPSLPAEAEGEKFWPATRMGPPTASKISKWVDNHSLIVDPSYKSCNAIEVTMTGSRLDMDPLSPFLAINIPESLNGTQRWNLKKRGSPILKSSMISIIFNYIHKFRWCKPQSLKYTTWFPFRIHSKALVIP